MREIVSREVVHVFCNRCERQIDTTREDFFSGEKQWGYKSEFDGGNHTFDLCGSCYKKTISTFKISPLPNLSGIR